MQMRLGVGQKANGPSKRLNGIFIRNNPNPCQFCCSVGGICCSLFKRPQRRWSWHAWMPAPGYPPHFVMMLHFFSTLPPLSLSLHWQIPSHSFQWLAWVVAPANSLLHCGAENWEFTSLTEPHLLHLWHHRHKSIPSVLFSQSAEYHKYILNIQHWSLNQTEIIIIVLLYSRSFCSSYFIQLNTPTFQQWGNHWVIS